MISTGDILPVRRLVMFADTHVGHSRGLSLPEFHYGDGGGYIANDIQRALFELYKRSSQYTKWRNPDVAVFVGDAIDGSGRRSFGKEQRGLSRKAQISHATSLLSMWGAKKFYFVRGTEYHAEAEGESVEDQVAKELGAVRVPAWASGQAEEGEEPYSGEHLFLDIEGVGFHFAHHLSTSSSNHYKSTAITRETCLAEDYAVRFLRDEMQGLTPNKTKVVVRAHIHRFQQVTDSSMTGIVLPCWEAQTKYMVRKGVFTLVPEIGFVGMEIRGNAFTIEAHTWKCHQVQAVPYARVEFSPGGELEPEPSGRPASGEAVGSRVDGGRQKRRPKVLLTR